MSAQLMVLPKVWGCAETLPATGAVDAAVRKGPQRVGFGCLHLVRAAAVVDEPTMMPDGPIVLRRQAEDVQGIGFAFYRKYTEAMLRRYMKMSMESGRVPSMLGREMFRGHVTNCQVQSFEDVSNFVHDVSRCLGTLDAGQRHLVRRIALEEYTMEETAAMLGMSLRTVVRRYREAVDRLTRVLLERGLLQPLQALGPE